MNDEIKRVKFDDDGLVPVVVQHATTGEVRMLGWANAEALEMTLTTGQVHFYSRSRQSLWRKGETSGNTLDVVEVVLDCDGDAVLVRALPNGPTCHTGAESCFHEPLETESSREVDAAGRVLADLEAIVRDRKNDPKTGSYTNELLDGGTNAIGRKVMEEAFEVVLAAQSEGPERLASEAADLLYHLVVLLADSDVGVRAVEAALHERRR